MYLQNYMYWYTLYRPSVSDPRLFKHFLATRPGHLEIEKNKNEIWGRNQNIFLSPIYTISFLPYFGEKA